MLGRRDVRRAPAAGVRLRRLLLAPLALLAAALLPLSAVATPAFAAGAGVLSITVTPVDLVTGQVVTSTARGQHSDVMVYKVDFSCATATCVGATVHFTPSQPDPYGIVTSPPRGGKTMLTYSTWTRPAGSTSTANPTGTDATGITFPLGDIAAGTSGSFLAQWSNPGSNTYATALPSQFYPDGFQIVMGATIDSSTATGPVSATASAVTWQITVPDPSITVTGPGVVRPGQAAAYVVRMGTGAFARRDSTSITGFSSLQAASNYTVTVPLPPQAVYTPGTASDGGVYDPVARTITWARGTIANPDYYAAGGFGTSSTGQQWATRDQYHARSFQVTYPASGFPQADANGCNFEATVNEPAAVTATYLDTARTTKSANAGVGAATVVSCYDPFGRMTSVKDSTNNGTANGHRQVYVPPDVTGLTCPAGGTDDWGRACVPGQPLASFGTFGYHWGVTSFNAGNSPGVFTVTDTQLDQADAAVYQISTTATTPTPKIDYTYRCGTSTPVTGTATATSVALTAAQVTAGCRYTSATVTSGSVAGGNIRPTDTGAGTAFGVYFWYSTSTTAPVGAVRTNSATATITYPGTTLADIQQPSSESIQFAAYPKRAVAKPGVSAAFTVPAVVSGGGNAVPGKDVTFSVQGATANIPANQDITPQYVFIAPVNWTITPGSASFGSQTIDPSVTFAYRTVTIAGVPRHVVVATWPNTVSFGENGTWPAMTVVAQPTAAVVAGTTSQATTWMGDSRNTYTNTTATFAGAVQDTPDVDADGVTTEWFATSAQNVFVSSADAVSVLKEICLPDGQGGCTWVGDSTHPVPVSTTASNIQYRVTITNSGNTNLSGIVAYDVLPYNNDVGTSDGTHGTPRGSTFNETLAGVSGVTAGLTLSYSSSNNPPRPEVYSGADTTGTWSGTPAGMQAIKAQYSGTLLPGGTVSFSYTANVGSGSAADAKACNSIAIDTAQTIPSEPPAVCALTAEADLAVSVPSRLPLQVGRPGVLPFTVVNNGGSVNAPATVTVNVPSGISVTSLTPTGWTCTASPTGALPIAGPVDLTCQPVDGTGAVATLTKDTPVALNVPVTATAVATQVCASAQITGAMHDPVLTNNAASGCLDAISGTAQLTVSKTDGVTTTAPGQTLTYTVTAANVLVGEQVNGAVITDTLPAGVTFVSAGNGGAVSGADPNGLGGTVTWPAVNLNQAGATSAGGSTATGGAGSTVTRTVTVKVSPGAMGNVLNNVGIAAPDPADGTKQLTATGSDSDALQRVTVSKSSNAAPSGVRTGDAVIYTVVLTNDGTAAYTAGNPATVLDDLTGVLDDATYASGTATVDAGTPSPISPNGAKHLVWSGALPIGSHVTLGYTVTVGAGADKVLKNTAWASGAVGTSCANGVDQNGIACASTQSIFAPVVGKRIQSFTQNDDGTWQIVYAIDVTNPSPVGSNTYSLSDTLRYGAGIQVVGQVTVTPPTGPAVMWNGTGTTTLATNATIAAGATQTYLVSVQADAHQVAGTAPATCATGVAGGFANTTTLSLTGRAPITTEACAEPVTPTIAKTVATPVQQPDGSWNVVYTVSVTNTHRTPADLAYSVGDALQFPAGTTINSVQATGTGANAAFNGGTTTGLVAGVGRIPAPTGTAVSTTQSYAVTVNVSAPLGSVAPSDLLCGPAGTGGYANTATLFAGTGPTSVGTASACATVTMDPMPTITKSVVSSAVGADGTWTLIYRIDVKNTDPTYATHYALADTLDFAAGVSILSESIAAPAGVTTSGWDGSASPSVFTGIRPLASGATDTYTVTVLADPGTLDAASAAADCRIDAGETGTGFRNVATVTVGGKSAFADACEPATNPSVVKTTVGQPTQDPDTGEWTTRYRITVTNKSTTTVGTIPYTVVDTLGFPAGVTVVDVSATDPTGAAVSNGFDGTTSTTLGTDDIGPAPSSNTPATRVWNVTVGFLVPGGLSNVPACDPAQGPGGLRNEGEVHVGQQISGSVACVDTPDVPAPVMSKSLVSQEQNPDGTWALVYKIDVQNPSTTAASTYTLDDQFAFGSGISLVGDATVDLPAAVPSTDWKGHNGQDIVSNELLPAGGTHGYTIHATADAGSVSASDAAADCTLQIGETGTGFLNTASLDTGVIQIDKSACASTYDPAVTKQLNGQPVQQPDGSWLISYTMTVTNPSDVQLSYGLQDEVDFPAGSTITVQSAASRAGGPAVVAGWDGQGNTQLVADGTALAPNAVHVLDVTLSVVLPANQQSVTGGWANTATVESGTGNAITADASAVADVKVPQLTVDKTVTADPVVRLGDTVTYQLVVNNVGDGDFTALYPAVVRDDLSEVLDDATLDGLPTVTPSLGAVTDTGDGFHWIGALTARGSVTIAYTVTTAAGGNADLLNTAFQAQPLDTDPATPDPCSGPTCASTDTPMPALNIVKTVREGTVAPGATLHYTVTVTNVSKVDIPVTDPATATDYLSGVLNNADYAGDANASTGQVSFSGSQLTWTGGLAAGAAATITYSVNVHSSAANGTKLENVAVSDPTLATLSLTGDPDTGRVTTTNLVVVLATTGVDLVAGGIGAAGMFLLLGALGLVYALRRRRRTT